MKHWIQPDIPQGLVDALAQSLSIHPLLARVMVQRGVDTPEAARSFFSPEMKHLHDPMLMQDMPLAVERLTRAIEQGERILLYGDYDVDGTACVAMMYAFLKPFYANIDYYLPDRDKEGYGVSMAGVEYAKAQGCSLIITMDCGIKAHTPVELARSYGIDFIISDHHVPEGELPRAVACLDPKRSDCNYPFKELSGCGVAFKLAQAYAVHRGTPLEELECLLDFVALSIACDIVPITGENRILAHFGLKKINLEPRLGIWALITRSRRVYPLNVNDLVFGLGPLINSAGRMGDAREAVRLLLSTDRNSALDAASRLVERNKIRQEADMAAANSARQRARRLMQEQQNSIVLFDPEWHKGIIGITASRLAEEFHKPTVILTAGDGKAVGSARSVPGFDLYAALKVCEPLFYSYGGHEHAAGIQMPLENVAPFIQQFESLVQQHLKTVSMDPAVEVVGELPFEAITGDFWQVLKKFAPFGPDNMNPVFIARGVVDTGKSKRLENNHVKLLLRHGKTTFSGVGFGLADRFEEIKRRPFDIAFNLREEQWKGENYLSLMVKDIR